MLDPASVDPLSSQSWRMNEMRLCPSEQRLYGADGAPIALERKAFDLLCFLVAQRDRVVSKDELLQQVWGRSVASDTVIAQAVSKARKALVSGGGDSEWIDVVRAVGYRYVGPAEVVLASSQHADPAAPPRPQTRGRIWRSAWLLVLLSLMIGAVAGTWWQRQLSLRDPLRIAVLPWRDDSGDASLQWAQLGLQALLVDALATDRRLAPVSQGSVRALLSARPDLVDAEAQAEYLSLATGADRVFAGRLARAGDGVVVELLALGKGPAASARLQGSDAASLAVAAAASVSQHLLPGFDPARPPPLSKVGFANEAYARGLDARLRGRSEEAARHLQSALDADPDMLAALYQLSVAQQLLRANDAWKATLDDLLARAELRGDRLYQGLALSGLGIHAWREAQLADAEALFRESATFFDAPSDRARAASVAANLGSLAAMQGRFDEAETEMSRALGAFEATGNAVEVARVSKNLGVLHVDRGRFAEAAPHFERSRALRQSLGLERDLAETLVSIGTADISMESPTTAVASLRRAAEIFAQLKDPLLESEALARLSTAQMAQGQLSAATETAAQSLAAARTADNASARGLAQLQLARLTNLRGDSAGALAMLDRAFEAMGTAQDQRGLAQVELLRLNLAPPTAQAGRARIDALIAELREGGWRSQQSDALAARAQLLQNAQPEAAEADRLEAFRVAEAIGEPALITARACELSAAALSLPTGSKEERAQARCREAATRDAFAARVQANLARAAGDDAAARDWLQKSKTLAGEAWTTQDEAELAALALQ
jgi:DNA-binding winged helix-turn-helix (wHTH) protein/tetratricopeptide (TPR) repeat protein